MSGVSEQKRGPGGEDNAGAGGAEVAGQVGELDVMRGQLDYLLEVAQRPTVSIQVVDPGCLPGMAGAFMIAELPNGQPDTIHADSPVQGQITNDREFVISIRKRYEATMGLS
jgi:hypothetical protein